MSDSYVEALQAERTKLIAERARLDGQLSGLDLALRLYQGPKPSLAADILRRVNTFNGEPVTSGEGTVKAFVISLVGQTPDGMASGDVLAEAERQGRPLNKNTVTSQLSALARQGVLEFANGRYRIPQGIPAAGAAGNFNPEQSVEAVEAARKAGGT